MLPLANDSQKGAVPRHPEHDYRLLGHVDLQPFRPRRPRLVVPCSSPLDSIRLAAPSDSGSVAERRRESA